MNSNDNLSTAQTPKIGEYLNIFPTPGEKFGKKLKQVLDSFVGTESRHCDSRRGPFIFKRNDFNFLFFFFFFNQFIHSRSLNDRMDFFFLILYLFLTISRRGCIPFQWWQTCYFRYGLPRILTIYLLCRSCLKFLPVLYRIK